MADAQIRIAAFSWLEEQTIIHGDAPLPRSLLEAGFEYKSRRITLIAPKGIWKPKYMELPISITTTSESPYDDSAIEDGNWLYKYRGKDPCHPDNYTTAPAILQRTRAESIQEPMHSLRTQT